MTLYINCCAREESRTNKLAKALLAHLGEYEEINLYETRLEPLDAERLKRRSALIDAGDYSDPMFDMAKKFSSAENIVTAAPYWDLSFPSVLKVFIENIYVTGIVSRYSEKGIPVGMCAAKMLYYVTTAGGPYNPRYSYDYISDMAKNYFGISDTRLICAEMLDIVGNDPERILDNAMTEMETLFHNA